MAVRRRTATYPRALRVNQVLRQVVAEELERLVDADEIPMVTVTSVEVAPDMRTAVVYLASLPEETAVVLEERRVHLQKLIGLQMTIKRTPRLTFRADPAIATGTRVEELLRGLHTEDEPEDGEPPTGGPRGPDAGGRRPVRRERRPRECRVWSWWTRRRAGRPMTSWPAAAASSGSAGSGTPGRSIPTPPGCCWSGLGRATRLMRFLTPLRKTYTTDIVLGTATSTLDASGEVTGTFDMARVTPDAVRQAATSLTGEIEQVPPMVSAVKVGGRRLHELARQGIEVERAARPVTVYRFDVEPDPARPPGCTGPRSSARRAPTSGCWPRTWGRARWGAHVTNLRRTRIGSFGGAEMQSARRRGTHVGADAGPGHARPRRGDGRAGHRRRRSARASPSTGCRSARWATARGRCSTRAGRCSPCTRPPGPTASGRPWCWPRG